MLCSFLAEFGVIIPQGTGAAVKYAKGVLEGEKPALPEVAVDVLSQLGHQLVAMHLCFRWYEMRMRLHSKPDKRVMLLRTIAGVGPVTAPAIVATVGDAKKFKNVRQFAAWLGLAPLNSSSGGKERLMRMERALSQCNSTCSYV